MTCFLKKKKNLNLYYSRQMCNMQEQFSLSVKMPTSFFHELFLIAVHSHGHGASVPRTRLCCRERAAVMPQPLASPEIEGRNSSFA